MKLSAADALRGLPEATRPLVAAALEAADRDDAAVYLVGGPVRDLLLGRAPRDVDLLFEAVPERTGKLLAEAKLADARLTFYERFGTFRLATPDAVIDISTARRETYPHPGALPQVEPGTLEEDLGRRDFSCNALALALSRAARARHRGIVAAEGAREDLEKRQLRVLHRASFQDDPTRALRAARLGVRLGFALSRDSRTALRDALRAGAFGRVSGDRLRGEWLKLFEDAAQGLDFVKPLRLLADWHVLAALEPGLELPRDAVVPLRRLGRFLVEPAFDPGRWRPWRVGLALWLAPLAPGLRRRTLGRFGVRGSAAERITGFRKLRDKTLRSLQNARGRGAVDAALRGLHEEELVGLHIVASTALRRRITRYANVDRHRKLPLQSSDWLDLGLEGPSLGRVEEALRVALLDGRIRTREEGLVLAGELARRRRPGRPSS
jgi:tRNA nucleotidyltransferase (CCA-adding enzyme)